MRSGVPHCGQSDNQEAKALTSENLRGYMEQRVTVSRNGAQWTGTIIGRIDAPALILEHDDGSRVAIVIEGASAVIDRPVK